MQKLLKLIRLSTKESFILLREKSPLLCHSLKENIKVTKIFHNHIRFGNKPRNKEEVIKRLLIIPLISRILKEGKLLESRKKEKNHYYKIFTYN